MALKAPDVPEKLARQVAAATEAMRDMGLYKPPGIAETLDWAQALQLMGADELDAVTVDNTLGSVLKYREIRTGSVPRASRRSSSAPTGRGA